LACVGHLQQSLSPSPLRRTLGSHFLYIICYSLLLCPSDFYFTICNATLPTVSLLIRGPSAYPVQSADPSPRLKTLFFYDILQMSFNFTLAVSVPQCGLPFWCIFLNDWIRPDDWALTTNPPTPPLFLRRPTDYPNGAVN